jgi:hypothetical protein
VAKETSTSFQGGVRVGMGAEAAEVGAAGGRSGGGWQQQWGRLAAAMWAAGGGYTNPNAGGWSRRMKCARESLTLKGSGHTGVGRSCSGLCSGLARSRIRSCSDMARRLRNRRLKN